MPRGILFLAGRLPSEPSRKSIWLNRVSIICCFHVGAVGNTYLFKPACWVKPVSCLLRPPMFYLPPKCKMALPCKPSSCMAVASYMVCMEQMPFLAGAQVFAFAAFVRSFRPEWDRRKMRGWTSEWRGVDWFFFKLGMVLRP